MVDKHILPIEILNEYRVDLAIPHEVEFTIVSGDSIDESALIAFAGKHGMIAHVEKADDIYIGTLTKVIVITEKTVRPLSEAVEALSEEHGWDYDGWGASSYK
jgi:hypothetical protein